MVGTSRVSAWRGWCARPCGALRATWVSGRTWSTPTRGRTPRTPVAHAPAGRAREARRTRSSRRRARRREPGVGARCWEVSGSRWRHRCRTTRRHVSPRAPSEASAGRGFDWCPVWVTRTADSRPSADRSWLARGLGDASCEPSDRDARSGVAATRSGIERGYRDVGSRRVPVLTASTTTTTPASTAAPIRPSCHEWSRSKPRSLATAKARQGDAEGDQEHDDCPNDHRGHLVTIVSAPASPRRCGRQGLRTPSTGVDVRALRALSRFDPREGWAWTAIVAGTTAVIQDDQGSTPGRWWGVQDELLADPTRPHGALLSVCPVPGCSAWTMGGTCVAHDPPSGRRFPRGRPHVEAPAAASRRPW